MQENMRKQRSIGRTEYTVILQLKDKEYLMAKFKWLKDAEEYVRTRPHPDHYKIEPNEPIQKTK